MLFNIAAVIGIRWLAAAAHTGPVSIVLWLLAAAFFFIPSALAVAALSARFPDEGGIYVWTKQGFGDWHGFLCGWTYWLSNLFYLPNLLLAGVDMAGYALGLSEVKIYVISASLLILWLGLATNIFGLSIAKWTNNAGAIATYTFGALLIVFGFAVWMRSGSATPMQLAPHWDLDKVNFWSQIAFAFGGLELGAVLGGEIRNPTRNVPRAAWISGACIAAFYILGTISLMVLMPPSRISILTGLVEASTQAGARLHSAMDRAGDDPADPGRRGRAALRLDRRMRAHPFRHRHRPLLPARFRAPASALGHAVHGHPDARRRLHRLRDRTTGGRKPAHRLPVTGGYDGDRLLHPVSLYVRRGLEVWE